MRHCWTEHVKTFQRIFPLVHVGDYQNHRLWSKVPIPFCETLPKLLVWWTETTTTSTNTFSMNLVHLVQEMVHVLVSKDVFHQSVWRRPSLATLTPTSSAVNAELPIHTSSNKIVLPCSSVKHVVQLVQSSFDRLYSSKRMSNSSSIVSFLRFSINDLMSMFGVKWYQIPWG